MTSACLKAATLDLSINFRLVISNQKLVTDNKRKVPVADHELLVT